MSTPTHPIIKTNPNTRLKGISTLIGCCFFHLVIGLIYPLGNFVPYLMSYLKHFNNSVTVQHGYFLMPIMSLISNIFGPIGGLVDLTLGPHRAIILGCFCYVGTSITLYLSQNLYLDYAIVVLFGIGISVSSGSISKHTCNYFPNHRGIVMAINGTILNLGMAGFNTLGEVIINPQSVQAYTDTTLYPFEVAENIKTFFLIQICLFCLFSMMALFFIFPYTYTVEEIERMQEGTNDDKVIVATNVGATKSFITNRCESVPQEDFLVGKNDDHLSDNINDDNGESLPVSGKVNPNEFTLVHIKAAIVTWRVWRLFICSFCSSFLTSLILTTSRPIGMFMKVPTLYLQMLGTGGFVVSCVVAPIWGLLIDKINFKYLFLVVNVLNSILGFSFYFSIFNNITYVIANLACTILFVGNIGMMAPHIMKVFGMKYFIEIGGLIIFSSGISSAISAVFAFLVDLFLKDNPLLSYLIIFMVAGGLSAISAILGFFEDDTKFEYDI